MTLKEKFQQIEITVKGCDDGNPCIISNKMFDNSAKQLEQIADDFAIGFKDWCDKFIDEVGDWKKDGVCLKNRFSTKELLQIYKKELGL